MIQMVMDVMIAASVSQIAQVVSRWTGIPIDKLTTGEREKLLKLSNRLADRVVGQEQPVQAVADAVMRSRAGLGRRQQHGGTVGACRPGTSAGIEPRRRAHVRRRE